MTSRSIAYFSMEVALEAGMPTYSGGLGVLAGDTLRSAADLGLRVVAVTLLHRKGYFFQQLDSSGRQTEAPVDWVVGDFLEEVPARISVTLEGREVQLRAWRYEVVGLADSRVPVFFLDADVPDNTPWDRRLTDHLYGGDDRYRLCQEVLLGIGGIRMLRALGYRSVERYHLNEGHSALLTLELLAERAREAGRVSATGADIEAVRQSCVFTTHTPVHAGHDQFPMGLMMEVLGHREDLFDLRDTITVDLVRNVLHEPAAGAKGLRDLARPGTNLNMTYLALHLSGYVNGVARKHGETTRLMFGDYPVDSITNGVHVASWVCEPVRALYDRHVPGWREDNFSLRSALGIPADDLWRAHVGAKRDLVDRVNRSTNAGMDVDHLTLGFARRATSYKRPGLVFQDLERLRQIAAEVGPLQLVFAGKAHPADESGKEVIRRVFEAKEHLGTEVRVAWLENYDLELARRIIPGVDVWLNTPEPPHEASGTSGMKAAINGVPSLSVLDGWWVEGHIEGVTGWAVESPPGNPARSVLSAAHTRSLHAKLHEKIAPLFYGDRDGFIDVMRHAIALNGSFFNTQRMLQQYLLKAYFPI